MSRVLAGFAGGIATGLGLLGLYHWRYGRKAPIGRIFKVGGRYYADSAVVDDLLRRVPGSQQYGDGGQLYLFRRGRVTFEQPHGYGGQLAGQVGPRLFVIHAYDTNVEGLVIEWIRFGLARPGAFFSTWPTEQTRGTWTPAPEPLHPFAFDPKRQASNAVAPLPEERPRPIGHYFQVGANFYAELAVREFDYTVDTDNEALKQLSAAQHAALRELVAEKARWKLDTRAGGLARAITAALDGVWRGHLKLDGSLSDVHVEGFTVKDGTLSANVVIAGALAVAFTP